MRPLVDLVRSGKIDHELDGVVVDFGGTLLPRTVSHVNQRWVVALARIRTLALGNSCDRSPPALSLDP